MCAKVTVFMLCIGYPCGRAAYVDLLSKLDSSEVGGDWVGEGIGVQVIKRFSLTSPGKLLSVGLDGLASEVSVAIGGDACFDGFEGKHVDSGKMRGDGLCERYCCVGLADIGAGTEDDYAGH
jgi:hypothetical protein